MTAEPLAQRCDACAAPLRADQRYCLQCGQRHGAPRVDPLLALGFEPEEPAVPAAPLAPAPPSRRTPSPRIGAALAATTLVLGGVAGAALGPGPAPSSAAAPQRVVALVVPQPAAATTAAPVADEAPPATDEDDAPTPTADEDAGAPSGEDSAPAPSPAPSTTDTTTKAPDGDEDDEDEGASSSAPATTVAPTVPTHVWLVALPATDPGAFGAGGAFADLAAQGTLLTGYAAAAPSAAADAVALLGGQVPAGDCVADVNACVLPAGETSLPDQLTAIGLTWKAYVEDAALRCAPAPSPRVGTSLFTTLRQRTDCATTTVGLDALDADLGDDDATPALSLVVPTDPTASLHALVAKITASKAYKDGGVLVLVPDVPPPGALVLSPRATAGHAVDAATGPIALLRSLDAIFGLDPLAQAAQAPAGALDAVLTPSPPTTTTTTTRRSP